MGSRCRLGQGIILLLLTMNHRAWSAGRGAVARTSSPLAFRSEQRSRPCRCRGWHLRGRKRRNNHVGGSENLGSNNLRECGRVHRRGGHRTWCVVDDQHPCPVERAKQGRETRGKNNREGLRAGFGELPFTRRAPSRKIHRTTGACNIWDGPDSSQL